MTCNDARKVEQTHTQRTGASYSFLHSMTAHDTFHIWDIESFASPQISIV
jgi:hypothetical protein